MDPQNGGRATHFLAFPLPLLALFCNGFNRWQFFPNPGSAVQIPHRKEVPIMFRSLFTSNRVSSHPMLFAGIAATGLAYLFIAGNPPRATAEDKPSKTVAAAAG